MSYWMRRENARRNREQGRVLRLERSTRICCKTEKHLPIGDTSCRALVDLFRGDSSETNVQITQSGLDAQAGTHLQEWGVFI